MMRKRHKNIGPFLAFGECWFRRHQRILLWLLNTPIVRLWFRWVLRIRPCDCPRSTPILEIAPNRFTVAGPKSAQRTTVFRTHPKYAKRLYFAFRPLWWLLHFWDWLVADRWVPELSFGFSTLTVHPDPDPELTTVDGCVRAYYPSPGMAYATLRSQSGNQAFDNLTDSDFVSLRAKLSVTGLFTELRRGILLFNTSALGGDDILSATLSLWGKGKGETLGATSVDIVASSPASNTALVPADYQTLGTTLFGGMDIAAFATSAYNDFALNAAGIANISKTGVSKFGARLGWDRTGTEPAWVSATDASVSIFYAEYTGTERDPKLTITHELPIIYLNRADAGSVSATESRSIFGTAQRTDAGMISAAESRSILASSGRADSGTISAVESSQRQIILQVFERSDAGAISAVEDSSLWIEEVIESETSDSGAITAVESSSVDRVVAFVPLSTEDSGALTVAEAASLVCFQGASDAGAISAVEASNLVKIYLPPPSAVRLRVAPWLKPGE